MIDYKKYKKRGSDYHWQQVGKSLRKRNLYVVGRYEIIKDLVKSDIRKKRILDLACGDGVLSYMLAKQGANVFGVDTSKTAIAYANSKCKNLPNVRFNVASVYALPFANDFFDFIIASEIIEHLIHPERMLSEISRTWNTKGKVIITTPIKLSRKPLDEMHHKEFFDDEFEEFLKYHFTAKHSVYIHKSHPVFWQEFQNKKICNRALTKVLLNLCNLLFGINPFKKSNSWKYYTHQIAVIE